MPFTGDFGDILILMAEAGEEKRLPASSTLGDGSLPGAGGNDFPRRFLFIAEAADGVGVFGPVFLDADEYFEEDFIAGHPFDILAGGGSNFL